MAKRPGVGRDPQCFAPKGLFPLQRYDAIQCIGCIATPLSAIYTQTTGQTVRMLSPDSATPAHSYRPIVPVTSAGRGLARRPDFPRERRALSTSSRAAT
eukprot:5480057-Prymnesium_polylepis.1